MSSANGAVSAGAQGRSDQLQLPVPPALLPAVPPYRVSEQKDTRQEFTKLYDSPAEQNGLVSPTVDHPIQSHSIRRTSVSQISPCSTYEIDEERVMDAATDGAGKHVHPLFQDITTDQSHCVAEPGSELVVHTDASPSSEAVHSVIVHQDTADDGWDAVAQQPESANTFRALRDHSAQPKPHPPDVVRTEEIVPAHSMRDYMKCWPDGVRDMPPIMNIFCVVFLGMVAALMFMLIITGLSRAI